jgi:muconate cycloisomerase
MLPFRLRFAHALAERGSTTNLFVRVTLSDGSSGVGEGVPREYVTGETPGAALVRVRGTYAPNLVGSAVDVRDPRASLVGLRGALHRDGRSPGSAWCAVESAILDAIGHSTNRACAGFFGGYARHRVQHGGVVPYLRMHLVAALLLLYRAWGLGSVKLKVGRSLEADVRVARLARAILGREVELRADANAAWSVEQTLVAAHALRSFGVSTYEQPVSADDTDGLRRLTAELPEAIMADESLCSVDDARRLAAARAADVFNVRISKCGGPIAALEIVQIARAAGIRCQLGAQVGESAVLRAVGRVVAGVVEPACCNHEGADNAVLLATEVGTPRALPGRGGWVAVPRGPGFGVDAAAAFV